ncbi:MAG: carboxypeptidase-like regulatory domain-containing protein [Acidobacteriia bacterium]|nr:carboxypeptidase-like regulatory domain-containing protein [Terriglobia bacterium]
MNNRSTLLKLVIWGVLFTLAMTDMVMAQVLNARMRGTVTDQSGAVIPGVKVTATNVGTGSSKELVSENDGSFEYLQLGVGNYKVTAEKSGFKMFTTTGIHLVTNQVYLLNISMEVGAVTQEVSVQANATQVETTNMQLGTVVSGSTIVDMPLNGRNWVQLQQLQPGVMSASDGRGSFSTNGGQTDQNAYLINGTDSQDLPLNTVLFIPSPDAIAEFRLVTNTLNPEYGRASGATVNAITKSGTNQFHGSGFEFFRDTSLDTRNFFGAPHQAVIFHQNQFGGTIGGPIRKNNTFFFFSYQGTRNRVPQAGGNSPVYTQDQRNGIFPDLATSSVLSPFPLKGENGTLFPAGTPYSTIFPTGHIPTADFNSVAAGLMNKFVPLPNSGANFLFNPTTTGLADQLIARIDHTFSTKDSIWGNWFWQRNPTTDTLPFTGANLPGFADVNQRHLQQYTANWTHVLNDHVVNEARFGYSRFNFAAVTPVTPTLPSSVGFTGITPQNPGSAGLPVITVSGLFTLGFSTNGPQPRIDQTYQVTDNLSWVKGKHTLKFGFDMRRAQVYNPFNNSNSGSFGFGGSGLFSTGNAGADFLLGIPDTYNQGSGDIINARTQEYYIYAQDQYKVRPNLTLTYGVGWQIDTPLNDNFHDNHAMVAFRPGQQSTVFPTAPVGYVFQGDAGVNASGSTYFKDFGPRFGFAWSPNWGWLSGGAGKMSIRGGFGLYFNRSLEEQTLQFLADPPFGLSSPGASTVAGGTGSPGFANPFCDVAGRGCVPNQFPFGGIAPGTRVDFASLSPFFALFQDPKTRPAYSQNFNLTVERQLPADMILSIGYVGALARHNVLIRSLSPGLNQAGCAANPSCVANRVNQGFVFPQNFPFDINVLGTVPWNTETVGNSNYNALQVSLNKHFSHGMQFLASYTWSHAMDNASGFEDSGFGGGGFGQFGSARGTNPFNLNAGYGNSAYDASQRFVFSYTYELPFAHLMGHNRLTDGWKITGITTFQSGLALDVVDGGFRSLSCWQFDFGVCADAPNSTGPVQFTDPRTASFVNGIKGGTTSRTNYWFNPNTFALEPFGTFGNVGRNNLSAPGVYNFDFALFKDTKITESTKVELRFEFYNFFNHTQFNAPGTTDVNSSNFGRITSAAQPRLIQLAAKFYF